MNILSPSILAADFTKLGDAIIKIDEAGAEYVHLDVMDGLFVPSISFGMPVIKSIRKVTSRVFDVHLMINEPVRYIKDFVKAGADIITVHVEACSDVSETLKTIREAGVKPSITLNPDTPVSAVLPYLNQVDIVMVMSVNPGFGGQKFIPETLEKVKELRRYIDDNQLQIDIEIDGGVNIENLASVLEAGANIIVAGSAVFKENISENVKNFKDIMSVW